MVLDMSDRYGPTLGYQTDKPVEIQVFEPIPPEG
jgi:hypothetical protein